MIGQAEQFTAATETDDVSGFVLRQVPLEGIAAGGCVIIFSLPTPPAFPTVPAIPSIPQVPGFPVRVERVR
jgi:hypothetical protein